MTAKLDRLLQKDILAILLSNTNAVSKFRKILDPQYFTIRSYRWLCKKIINNFEKFDGELLSKKSALLLINKEMPDDEKKKEFRKRILPLFSRKVASPKHLSEEIYNWAENQKFGLVLQQAAEKTADGDLESGKEIVKSSFLFDIERTDFDIHSLLETWKDRQRERKRSLLKKEFRQIKMRLGPLDDHLFIRKNQSLLALIMGTSGVGKSIFSINTGTLALNAACKVAHFVFENTARQTLARYDSRLVKYPYHYLTQYKWNKRDLAVANYIMRNLRKKRKRHLKVIHAPIDTVSIIDIESLLREFEIVEKWIPDVIIYDSLDHMLPSERQESFRLSVGKTYKDAKRQSEIREIPIVSTTHAKASARGTRVRQESFSESYDKPRLADVVLTISQTQEQEDDRQAEIWLDKWRDGEGKIGILVDLLFRVMTIKFLQMVERGGESVSEEHTVD
jgi:archaellum biogenesis ATPase FlaH